VLGRSYKHIESRRDGTTGSRVGVLCRPYGAQLNFSLYPALSRWAKLSRPCGAGFVHITAEQRRNWKIAGGGYGIHWPEIDEDISTEGLLRGAPAPNPTAKEA
jgi:hypothetical protein